MAMSHLAAVLQNGGDVDAATIAAAGARRGDQARQSVVDGGVGGGEGGDAQEFGGQQLVDGRRRLLQPVRQVPAQAAAVLEGVVRNQSSRASTTEKNACKSAQR